MAAAKMQGRARRLDQARDIQVAAWDIDSVFPALDQTLERMNEAQDVFGFKRADLSPPLDIWDPELRDESHNPYLDATKLAARMQPSIFELRVDILVCITRHWMTDDETKNIYAWWGSGAQPVVVLSFAGFDDLDPEGPETDRTIANVIVTALAGKLAQVGTHPKGAKNCPMYLNAERDLEALTARQLFDKHCRSTLKKAVPRELPALEAILATF